MNISHKRVPNGWQYLLALGKLKKFLKPCTADVRSVEYSGALKSTYEDFWIPATFESRVVDDCLVFRLSFAALPITVFDSIGRDLQAFAIDSVADFLLQGNEEIASTTAPRYGSIRIFRFDADEDYNLKYDWKETDKRKLPSVRWW